MGKSEKKRQKREYVFNSKGVASPHSDDFRSLVAQIVKSKEDDKISSEEVGKIILQ